MKSNTNGCNGSAHWSGEQLALAATKGSIGVPSVPSRNRGLLAAEFFAGIGLVRAGLKRVGVDVVWANDIEPVKHAVYAANFDAAHYVLGDIREVKGTSVPGVDIATASFLCVDLSLAGNRKRLEGSSRGCSLGSPES